MNKSSSYSQAAAKFNLQAYPQKVLKYAFIHVRNPKQKQIKKKNRETLAIPSVAAPEI